MRYVAGQVFDAGDFIAGHIAWSDAGIEAIEAGPPPEPPVAEGVVVPSFVNAHTHLGDSFARGTPLPGDLAAVVKPPDGLKHRLLRTTPPEKVRAGIRDALSDMRSAGTRLFCDFREGGLPGFEMLQDALLDAAGLKGVVLTRPSDLARPDEAEMAELLARSDGFGASGIADVPQEVLARMSSSAHEAGKRFAIHASEGEREDIGAVLDLEPDLLVHLTHSADEDLEEVADEDVPVVVCPRSNAIFGFQPDVEAMLDAGITLALGTDNGMFGEPDVLAEMRFLRESQPGVPPGEILEMAVAGGRKALSAGDFIRPWEVGGPVDFIVLGPSTDQPWETLFAPTTRILFDPMEAP